MKMLICLFTLALCLNVLADSGESKTFIFDGSRTSEELILRGTETHTEYRYENYQTTCTRTVTDYQTVCSSIPRTICRNTPQGQVCSTHYVRECHQRPVYRTVYYPCTQTRTIPYEVKDYDVEANVNINVAALPGAAHGETFKVTLNGDRLSLTATSTGSKYFVMLNKQEISSSISGSVKFIDASYSAGFVEAAPVVKALSLTNISLKNSVLSFKMGPVAARELIGFHLQVKDAPVLGSDTTIFDRELNASEIQLSAQGEASAADVNIQKLGIQLSSGRYAITAKAFFKHAGTLLNASQFEATEASRTLIYKIR